MSENAIFQEKSQSPEESGKKSVHTASLVLGILSIVLGLMVALVGEVLGILGIVFACKNRKEMNTKAALICSIIGLVLSVINHVAGILLLGV